MTREQMVEKYQIRVEPAYMGFGAWSDVLGADFFSSGAYGRTEAEAVEDMIEQIEDWEDRDAD